MPRAKKAVAPKPPPLPPKSLIDYALDDIRKKHDNETSLSRRKELELTITHMKTLKDFSQDLEFFDETWSDLCEGILEKTLKKNTALQKLLKHYALLETAQQTLAELHKKSYHRYRMMTFLVELEETLYRRMQVPFHGDLISPQGSPRASDCSSACSSEAEVSEAEDGEISDPEPKAKKTKRQHNRV